MQIENPALLREAIADIELFVLAGNEVNPALARWLEIVFPPQQVHIFDPRKEIPDQVGGQPIEIVCAARNEIARRFLEGSRRKWLVQFDDDMYPAMETLELFTSDLPLTGCRAWSSKESGESHDTDGVVSMSASKISRDLLEAMTDPYFDAEWEGDSVTFCECQWFSRATQRRGHWPTKVGYIGHVVPFVVTPIPGKRARLKQQHEFPLPRPEDFAGILD